MKRRRSRNIEPDQYTSVLPMDMLRAIAAHADVITARLMCGLCRATHKHMPRTSLPVWDREAWCRALPDAHASVLKDAQWYICATNGREFYYLVMTGWTKQDVASFYPMFFTDQDVLYNIHFAQAATLGMRDDWWALDLIEFNDYDEDEDEDEEHTIEESIFIGKTALALARRMNPAHHRDRLRFGKLLRFIIKRAWPRFSKEARDDPEFYMEAIDESIVYGLAIDDAFLPMCCEYIAGFVNWGSVLIWRFKNMTLDDIFSKESKQRDWFKFLRYNSQYDNHVRQAFAPVHLSKIVNEEERDFLRVHQRYIEDE